MRSERRASTGPVPNPSLFLLIAILLVAAFLRLHRLDAQSFWNDEGNSARIAERSLDRIVEGAAGDVHPPGYYILLRYWRGGFGESEFALRSLSVAAGLVLVGLTYLVGRYLFGEGVGLIAAFLGALSPFAVYYSQEARMYALLGALAALSTFVAIRLVHVIGSGPGAGGTRLAWRGPLTLLGGYVLANGAGLYTHYAFGFMLMAHNVLFGLRWLGEWRRGRVNWRSLTAWTAAQAAVILLYLPWLPTALNAAGWDRAGGGYALVPALKDVMRVLTVGITLPPREAWVGMAASGLLMVVGLVAVELGRRPKAPSRGWATAALLVYLIVPLGLFFGFDLYKPAWLKFLVVLLLPFHLLVARGAASLAWPAARVWERGRAATGSGPIGARARACGFCWLILLPVVATAGMSLHNLAFDPTYFRDDYRQIAADIEARRRPGDGIILNAPNQWEVFTYYYPDRDIYPAPYRPTPGEADSFLTPILQKHGRLFVLYWGDGESDPQKHVEAGLAQRAYRAGDRWYGSVRLATYGTAGLPLEPSVRLDGWFGRQVGPGAGAGEPAVVLRGYALAEEGPFSPGDLIPLTLFWEAGGTITESYKVTVQLLDDVGQLSAQVDGVPGDGLAPTTLWREGEMVVDRYGIAVPDDLAPGGYALMVAVYHGTSGERLGVTTGEAQSTDHVILDEVVVGP